MMPTRPPRYVSLDCFKDYAIRAFINSRAVAKKCSYCGRQQEQNIAAHISAVVQFIEDGLLRAVSPQQNEALSMAVQFAYGLSPTDALASFWPELPHPLVKDLADGQVTLPGFGP